MAEERLQKILSQAGVASRRHAEQIILEGRVTVNGAEVHLSSAEFDLLAAFLNRPRVVFSRNQLVDVLWGDAFYGELRLVDNHVYRLREKLTAAGLSPCPIVTIRGVGYAFRPDE